MRKLAIFLVILALFAGFLYFYTPDGPFEPVGRLAFVKLANPDCYPGHPHSKLMAEYAHQRDSKSILVVHYGGDSNYRHYMEGDVLILEMAFVEKKTYTPGINWAEVLQEGLYGVPDEKWTYRADGKEFQTLDEALDYVQGLAEANGQEGSIPLLYHGTVRDGSPIINQGCGFPLYYKIVRQKYGILTAYACVIKGFFFPYFNLPYRNFELTKTRQLQYYYVHGMIDYE